VFCPLGVARLLRKIGFQQVHELDWWQTAPLGNMQVHCVPAQHFSARTPFDRDRTLWCGWLLEPAGGSIYFAGDTGFGAHFSAIQRKFNSIRLALLPIGAYKPEWFMSPIHMGPEEAIEAHKILDPTTSIAIHFGTFALADDGQLEATDRLSASLGRLAEPSRMWILKEGERRIIPAVELRPI
jgi:L-ascorbate metabolism protein UlaG (beta-lactamase superfamily)